MATERLRQCKREHSSGAAGYAERHTYAAGRAARDGHCQPGANPGACDGHRQPGANPGACDDYRQPGANSGACNADSACGDPAAYSGSNPPRANSRAGVAAQHSTC